MKKLVDAEEEVDPSLRNYRPYLPGDKSVPMAHKIMVDSQLDKANVEKDTQFPLGFAVLEPSMFEGATRGD